MGLVADPGPETREHITEEPSVHMRTSRSPLPWTDDGFSCRSCCASFPLFPQKASQLEILEIVDKIGGFLALGWENAPSFEDGA